MSATPTRYVIVDVEPFGKLYYTDGLELSNAGIASVLKLSTELDSAHR
jgi:hypothetical protein